MESDVILQEFQKAEKKHGVRYMRVVGDGDSSVFAKIREEVPGWGRSAKNQSAPTSNPGDTDNNETVIINDQIDFWTEGSSISCQEEARGGTCIDYTNVEQHIIRDVTIIINRIAEKSDRLLGNSTTNLAESWMHIRTKFDGGKVYNICNRGSWHARCYGGALRMNLGPQWSCKVWESSTGTEPGFFYRKLYARHEQTLANSTRYKSKPSVHQLRWKKKFSSLKTSTTRKATRAYGPEATDVVEDVSTTVLQKLQDKFLQTHINLSAQQCKNITTSTVHQSQSGLWHSERKKRITASNFGSIVKRNPSLPIAKFVRTILYSSFSGNRHTRNGINQEDSTIEEYKLKKAEENENVSVERSGLVIHYTNKYLAASPDGIVTISIGETGIIEIKNLLHSKPLNLWQASENKTFCLENTSGKLQLKENHNYFYQCHGLLNICNKDWIDFVVRTLNPYQIFIQRIHRDVSLWENTMLPKLQSFYNKAILPELASPREGKSPGIREPGMWYVNPVKPKTQKGKRKQSSTSSNKQTRKQKSRKSSSSDSDITDNQPQGSGQISQRKTRQRQIKFLGRTIKHEWIIDETSQQKEWYKGTVVSLLSGTDGRLTAIYEVLYEGADEPFEIDHLIQDYQSGSVQFIDV
ncbi:Hypothetical predicted protein [Mytilus galloprovincialis]|uniref:YqaJ viral recombinase domain-containing protein n=1 Tax=Mytilus galloprovincialis TaxID=29158 RepID=A0A8B6FF08_MYTGA|nr:Hypothetical predicted protein [Mytilus galloprovincialis]